jgi:hypothetical protein
VNARGSWLDSAESPASGPASGPTTRAVRDAVLPNVLGMNLREAQDTMRAAGFLSLTAKDATGQNRSLLKDWDRVVTRQEPDAGKRVPPSTRVVLYAKEIMSPSVYPRSRILIVWSVRPALRHPV